VFKGSAYMCIHELSIQTIYAVLLALKQGICIHSIHSIGLNVVEAKINYFH